MFSWLVLEPKFSPSLECTYIFYLLPQQWPAVSKNAWKNYENTSIRIWNYDQSLTISASEEVKCLAEVGPSISVPRFHLGLVTLAKISIITICIWIVIVFVSFDPVLVLVEAVEWQTLDTEVPFPLWSVQLGGRSSSSGSRCRCTSPTSSKRAWTRAHLGRRWWSRRPCTSWVPRRPPCCQTQEELGFLAAGCALSLCPGCSWPGTSSWQSPPHRPWASQLYFQPVNFCSFSVVFAPVVFLYLHLCTVRWCLRPSLLLL